MRRGLSSFILSTGVVFGAVGTTEAAEPAANQDGIVQLGSRSKSVSRSEGVVQLGQRFSPPVVMPIANETPGPLPPSPGPTTESPDETGVVEMIAPPEDDGSIQVIPDAPAAPQETERRVISQPTGAPLQLLSREPNAGGQPVTASNGSFWVGTPQQDTVEFAQDVPQAYWVGHYYQGDGIGYEDGYWTVGYFMPIYEPNDNNMVYSNSRMLVQFDGDLGTNVGLGYRRLSDSYILGGNVWYDSDESISENRYDQIAAGVELLTRNFDIVVNGYFPLQTETRQSRMVTGTNPEYAGNQIVFVDTQFSENAMTGGDFSIGFPMPGNPWLKTYLGAYIYDPEVSDAETGFRAIVRANITEAAAAEVRVTDDDFFGTNVVLGVDYKLDVKRMNRWDFSDCCRWYRQPRLADRMYEEPFRYNRVAVRQTAGTRIQNAAINPKTGQAYFVNHVNATAAPGGNGTAENPYKSLASASGNPGDVILVRSAGTSASNPIVGGVQLADCTRVLGEGQAHLFEASGRGTFQFPNFASSGPAPFVSAPGGGPVITLANQNEVNSLNLISSPGAASIAGSGIRDFDILNINRDIPAGNSTGSGSGILLSNAAGLGRIENVRFASSDPNSTAGIGITNSGGSSLDLMINNVSEVSGSAVGVRLDATNSTINANLNNVIADNNGKGMQVVAGSGGTVNASIENSSFDNANAAGIGDGLQVDSRAGSTVVLNVANSTFDNATRNGIRIAGDGASAQGNLDITLDAVSVQNQVNFNPILIQVDDGGGTSTVNFRLLGNRGTSVLSTPSNMEGLSGSFIGGGTTANLLFDGGIDVITASPNDVVLDASGGANVSVDNSAGLFISGP
ncbi:inverse autotransporter beta domain-containing protein [Thalassoroseus pseudoceratinae]|uniref:inverse autotransporter beta domain-containing protein n=1 Tax=Thalassoroseus pseudoceratinae TaxID=2713176 RepID=UPI001421CA6F|nr:inverse autotransporter beta domain-containing protein [Thalassoroseus pseudoceratinae]